MQILASYFIRKFRYIDILYTYFGEIYSAEYIKQSIQITGIMTLITVT